MARPRFQQHPITPRIWGTVRNAMLNCVNVDSAPKRLVQPLLLSTFHNLIHREVWRFWMLAMKQRSGDPNFVRDLKFRFDCCQNLGHGFPRKANVIFQTLACRLDRDFYLTYNLGTNGVARLDPAGCVEPWGSASWF